MMKPCAIGRSGSAHGSASPRLDRPGPGCEPESRSRFRSGEKNMIADLRQDLRYGARMLLKQPGFTLLAVLTLALGIGATTTIFSAIWNILLNPFPYPDAHRMVAIRIQDTSRSGRGRGPQTLEVLD